VKKETKRHGTSPSIDQKDLSPGKIRPTQRAHNKSGDKSPARGYHLQPLVTKKGKEEDENRLVSKVKKKSESEATNFAEKNNSQATWQQGRFFIATSPVMRRRRDDSLPSFK